MNRSTAVMLQARLGSTRLPGKVLLPLAGKPIAVHAMEALSRIPAQHYLLLTDEASLMELAPLAATCGFTAIAGSADDVLLRFTSALEAYPVERVVRATADNPAVSSTAAIAALELLEREEADYAALDGLPLGCGVEAVRAQALIRAGEEATDSYDREHVCPYLYRNPALFKSVREAAAEKWQGSGLSLTVDTQSDYINLKFLFSRLYDGKPLEPEQLIRNLVRPDGPVFYPSVREGNGMGHLYRCLKLASGLPGCSFYTEDPQRFELLVQNSGREMPWLIAPSQVSGSSCIIADNRKTDVLPPLLRESGKAVVALDEGGRLRGEASMLLDAFPMLDGEAPNRRISPLLNPAEPGEYSSVSKTSSAGGRDRSIDLLVSFGGEDPKDLSSRLVKLLGTFRRYTVLIPAGLKITVVTGPGYRGRLVRPVIPAGIDLTLIKAPSGLQALMARSRIVITSFGLTAYEAVEAGCELILWQPSRYHHRLARKEGMKSFPGSQGNALVLELSKRLRSIKTGREREDAGQSSRAVDAGMGHESALEAIRKWNSPVLLKCPCCSSVKRRSVARLEERSFFRCRDCGTLWQQFFGAAGDRYTEDYFFEEYRKQYGKTYLEDFEPIHRMGMERCSILKARMKDSFENPGGQPAILDVGAAYGHFLHAAKESGFLPTGVDISESAVSHLKKEGFSAGQLNIDDFCKEHALIDEAEILREFCRISGINDDRLADGFDAVSLWFVIEHLEDVSALGSVVKALLKPGGQFAFSTPNGRGVSALRSRLEFLKRSPVDHHLILTPVTARRMLKRMGFHKIRFRITGHHPERFFSRSLPGSLMWFFSLLSRVFQLGDTFECYAQLKDKRQ